MAEESDAGSADRRATWVALRTLRQRPTVVGRTSDGRTVFEVRSVRLVLGAGAPYFHKLVQCAKCGCELTGPAVLTPADLDQPTNARVCDLCVRSAVPAYRSPEKRPQEPSAAPAPPRDAVAEEPEAAGPVDDERVALVDARLAEMTARLAALAGIDERVRRLSQRVDDVLKDQQGQLGVLAASLGHVRERLATEVQAGMAAATVDGERGRVQAALAEGLASLEHRIEVQASALTDLMDGLRADFEKALEGAMHQVLMATAEPLRDLERSREEIQATLAVLQRQVVEGDLRGRALEERLDGSIERLTDLVTPLTRPSGVHRSGQSGGEPVEGGLLAGLDWQLREAEGRLAQHLRASQEDAAPASR